MWKSQICATWADVSQLVLKDEVIADWTATPGVHILHAPAAPVVDLDDLNDADLDSMSAGSDPSSFFIKG